MEHRHLPHGMPEHDGEPELGLPEALPKDEHLIWQGSPDWKAMARDVFHVQKIAIYFCIIVGIRMAVVGSEEGFLPAVMAALWLLPLIIFALGILTLMAYLSARDTMYTITDKRLVMRIGIALTLSYNIPLRLVSAAGLHLRKDGTGDIPLNLTLGNKIGYINLWPHARPWRIANPEPMLRCLPNVKQAAEKLASALQLATRHSVSVKNTPNSTTNLETSSSNSALQAQLATSL